MLGIAALSMVMATLFAQHSACIKHDVVRGVKALLFSVGV
jgi:hypothetical protein